MQICVIRICRKPVVTQSEETPNLGMFASQLLGIFDVNSHSREFLALRRVGLTNSRMISASDNIAIQSVASHQACMGDCTEWR